MLRLKRHSSASAISEQTVVSAEPNGGPRNPARAQWLKTAAVGLAAAVAAGLGRHSVADAATNDPLLLGNSGNTGNPNLAEDATEVQYDGAGPPLGVVFLAQADNKYAPANASFPSALAGWTSTNPDIPNGVYGYTERPDGRGIVGWAPLNVGGWFIGPNRAPLHLQPESVPAPPATGQAGDLYVTINVDNVATLWFHTGLSGWQRVVTTP